MGMMSAFALYSYRADMASDKVLMHSTSMKPTAQSPVDKTNQKSLHSTTKHDL